MQNLKASEISTPIKEMRKNGIVEASKALSKASTPQAKVEPAKAKKAKQAKPTKAEPAKPVEPEKLTATIPKEQRTKYQNRTYLNPAYNAPELEGKFPDTVALKTLFVDRKGEFHVWDKKTAKAKIETEFLSKPDLKEFHSGDVAKFFKLFGGGVGDITRSALALLAKEGKIVITQSGANKKKHYSYSKA